MVADREGYFAGRGGGGEGGGGGELRGGRGRFRHQIFAWQFAIACALFVLGQITTCREAFDQNVGEVLGIPNFNYTFTSLNIDDAHAYASIMEQNFGASVKEPDAQLMRHLNDPTVVNRERHAPTRRELLHSLYGIADDADFYDGFAFPEGDRAAARFPVREYVSNFVVDHPLVFALIETLMPANEGSINFIVEAGSFVGSSANTWAPFARRHNATVLCIDTWEGDVNMWVLPGFRRPMSVDHGYGRGHLFENFVQNVIDGGSADVVLPMAVSSLVGAKVLWAQKFAPDVAYIDTAHEQGETLGEMFAYWELLRPGGVLLGDDYHYFPAVKRDVDAFVAYKNLELHFTRRRKTFAIKKPIDTDEIRRERSI